LSSNFFFNFQRPRKKRRNQTQTRKMTIWVSVFSIEGITFVKLAVLGGKTAPASGDIEKILSSVGIEVDTEKLKKVLSELNGKSIDDLLTQGREKLATVPAGGGAAAPAAAEAAPAAVEEKKEAKKEEKKPDSDSEDDDMGFGLFD
jgi:large subunit ribosomal protein LP2